jgi:hypothetical protein
MFRYYISQKGKTMLSVNNNTNPSFGHSFRVSICLKNGENAACDFVRPYCDRELYKKLNSRIVTALNKRYYDNLRTLLGVPRKVKKISAEGKKFEELEKELIKRDTDYSMFNLVRSVYKGNKIGCIVTGPDVSIIEQSTKHIGEAKSDAGRFYGTTKTDFVRDLWKLIKGNIKDYAENESVLLRSPDDREIMLKAIFKKIGKKYELDDFEFHEIMSKPRLKPVNPELKSLKRSSRMLEEIKKTVENHIYQITGRRMNVRSLDKILYPKID